MTNRYFTALVVFASVSAAPMAFAQNQNPPAASVAPAASLDASASSPEATVADPTVSPDSASAPAPAPDAPSPAESTVAPPLPVNTAASAAAADIPVEDPGAYRIGPEDILDISVWKNPELSRTVPVRPDGNVSLPLVDDIKAAGLTPAALRDQVTARLAEFIPAPEVSVMVREVHSRKVAVIGAVKTPGRFEIKSPMTVLEAIALAQGFTDFANRDRIVVLRQNGSTTLRMRFNYSRIADDSTQENFAVKPGDIIVVP